MEESQHDELWSWVWWWVLNVASRHAIKRQRVRESVAGLKMTILTSWIMNQQRGRVIALLQWCNSPDLQPFFGYCEVRKVLSWQHGTKSEASAKLVSLLKSSLPDKTEMTIRSCAWIVVNYTNHIILHSFMKCYPNRERTDGIPLVLVPLSVLLSPVWWVLCFSLDSTQIKSHRNADVTYFKILILFHYGKCSNQSRVIASDEEVHRIFWLGLIGKNHSPLKRVTVKLVSARDNVCRMPAKELIYLLYE